MAIDNPRIRKQQGSSKPSSNPIASKKEIAGLNKQVLSPTKTRDFPRLVKQMSSGTTNRNRSSQATTPGGAPPPGERIFDDGVRETPDGDQYTTRDNPRIFDEGARDTDDSGVDNPRIRDEIRGGSGGGLFPNRTMSRIIDMIHQAVADGNLSPDERHDIEAARMMLVSRAESRVQPFKDRLARPVSRMQEQLQRRAGRMRNRIEDAPIVPMDEED